jgi:hypothetical protein
MPKKLPSPTLDAVAGRARRSPPERVGERDPATRPGLGDQWKRMNGHPTVITVLASVIRNDRLSGVSYSTGSGTTVYIPGDAWRKLIAGAKMIRRSEDFLTVLTNSGRPC